MSNIEFGRNSDLVRATKHPANLIYSIRPYALHIASAASDVRLIVDKKAAKADVVQGWPCNSRKYGWYGHNSCHADWYGLSTRCTPIVLD